MIYRGEIVGVGEVVGVMEMVGVGIGAEMRVG